MKAYLWLAPAFILLAWLAFAKVAEAPPVPSCPARFNIVYDNGVLIRMDNARGRIDAWYYTDGAFVRIQWRNDP